MATGAQALIHAVQVIEHRIGAGQLAQETQDLDQPRRRFRRQRSEQRQRLERPDPRRLVGHGRRLVEQFHEHGHHLASRLPDPSQRRRRLPPAEPRRLRIAHDRDQPRNRAFDFGSREVEIGNPPPPLLECKTVVPPLRVPGGRNVRLTR